MFSRRIALYLALACGLALGATVLARATGPRSVRTTHPTTAVAYSPDGAHLGIAQEWTVRVGPRAWHEGGVSLEPSSVERIAGVLHLDRPSPGAAGRRAVPCGLEFSPDGALLLSLGRGGADFTILDAKRGERLWSRERAAHRANRVVGFGDNREFVYLELNQGPPGGDERLTRHRARLVVCEATTGRIIRERALALDPGEWPLRAVRLPGQETVACITRVGNPTTTLSDRSKLVLLDLRTGRRMLSRPIEGVPNELAWSPDGSSLITLEDDGAIRLWSRGLEPRGRIAGVRGRGHTTRGEPDGQWLDFAPDGRRVAGFSRERVAVWDLVTRRLLRSMPMRSRPSELKLSPDGNNLAIADGAADLSIWKL